MMTNLILQTDSYKVTHWKQYPPRTQNVYSYFESRPGATYPYTVFFGLQYLLKQYLEGRVVTRDDLREAQYLLSRHFGADLVNEDGWNIIIDEYNGRLPLRICAVPEGTKVPTGNVLMTIENTDPRLYWLTNYVESLLTHVWYPSTVATLSAHVREDLTARLLATGSDPGAVQFMLHDFGYRGATTDEAAALGGAGHLVNFSGTDTLSAMQLLQRYYAADPDNLAFSVPATEHSVMTALGQDGEFAVLDQVLDAYPTGIVSVVADSYDIYAFTEAVIARKERILARDGRFVERPDSVTPEHPTPALLVVRLVDDLWNGFGGSTTPTGHKVLDPHVRLLWGDGIERDGVDEILEALDKAGYAAENMVFGMGGGLLQKVNRDTQRFAFKCSAQYRDGQWHSVQKTPLDASKKSKAGRLWLTRTDTGFETLSEGQVDGNTPANALVPVFHNGHMLNEYTLDEIRKNAWGS